VTNASLSLNFFEATHHPPTRGSNFYGSVALKCSRIVLFVILAIIDFPAAAEERKKFKVSSARTKGKGAIHHSRVKDAVYALLPDEPIGRFDRTHMKVNDRTEPYLLIHTS
jgi:hypothetical protein